jgi:hypothetical protein
MELTAQKKTLATRNEYFVRGQTPPVRGTEYLQFQICDIVICFYFEDPRDVAAEVDIRT